MMVYQDAVADNCQKKDDVLIFQIIHLKDKWKKIPQSNSLLEGFTCSKYNGAI